MDQEPQGLFSLGKLPNPLPGLLSHPDRIGIGFDTGEMASARTQFDEEEHVNGLQQDGFHGEKVTGQNLILVMGHEMTLTQGAIANRSGENAVTIENVANGWLRDLETQLEECSSDFTVTPTGFLLGETEN
jgi:hypothetical protein